MSYNKSPFLAVLLFILFSCMPRKNEEISVQIPEISVLLKTISKTDTVHFNDTYIMNTEEARYEFGQSNDEVYITPVNDGYKVFNDNRLFLLRRADRITFIPESETSTYTIGRNSYAGQLKIVMTDSGSLYLINNIDLESYLKGVVPAEIFTDNDTLLDAVKAQAICARSYALKKMDSNKTKPFNIFADIRDQVYKGTGIQTTLGDFAVDETSGIVIMHGKEIADIYFHASCGGILENASNVWPGENEPYLTTRQDVIGKQFADIESPFYRWTKKRTSVQLDSLYKYNFGISHLSDLVQDTVDIPLIIKVSERYPSGRIKKMYVQYGTDRHELSGYQIRRFFGWPPGTLLPSTLIRFSGTDSVLIIRGAGRGHGVGLCQYGALYKAQKGLQYYHILQSYFPGTTLKRLY